MSYDGTIGVLDTAQRRVYFIANAGDGVEMEHVDVPFLNRRSGEAFGIGDGQTVYTRSIAATAESKSMRAEIVSWNGAR